MFRCNIATYQFKLFVRSTI